MATPSSNFLHASAVAFEGCGLLLLGASGSGKSSLALMLCDAGGTLIGDDQIEIFVQHNNTLMAQSAQRLEGLLEVRGFGIAQVPFIKSHEIHAAITLKAWQQTERLPHDPRLIVMGVKLPHFEMDPMQPSVLPRLKLIVRQLITATHGTQAQLVG